MRAASLLAQLDTLLELRRKARVAMIAEARRQSGWRSYSQCHSSVRSAWAGSTIAIAEKDCSRQSVFAEDTLEGTARVRPFVRRIRITSKQIVPGHPEQSGAHERMHRTLKAETTRPPEQTMDLQQKRFDEFRNMFNNERPHETLGQKRPATIYRPSPRPYPESLPPIEYASHLETRKISHNGMMRWKRERIFTSKTLTGEWSVLKRSTTALVAVLRTGAAGPLR